MPGTVDDFMQRFGSGATIDDREAAQYHDRFVSTHDDDRDFDKKTYHEGATEYLGKLPDDQFHEAAKNAVAQAPEKDRQGLLGGLMSALGGGGGQTGIAALANSVGLGSTDPSKMSADDGARLMNYARKEHPEALRQTVEEKPWLIRALGNPIVIGALTMAATKLLSNQRAK